MLVKIWQRLVKINPVAPITYSPGEAIGRESGRETTRIPHSPLPSDAEVISLARVPGVPRG